MRQWKAALGLFVVLGLAVPAVAAPVWKKLGSDTVTTNLAPGTSLYYDFSTEAVTGAAPYFSPVIETHQCTRMTMQFDPDLGGETGLARVYVWSCVGHTASVNECGKVLVNNSASAGVTDTPWSGLDGSSGQVTAGYNHRILYDITGLPYIAIQVTAVGTTTPAAAHLSRVLLTCMAPGS